MAKPQSSPGPPPTAEDLSRHWRRIVEAARAEIKPECLRRSAANPWVAALMGAGAGIGVGVLLGRRKQARPAEIPGAAAETPKPPASKPQQSADLNPILSRLLTAGAEALARKLKVEVKTGK
jgi:hypothetical protein